MGKESNNHFIFAIIGIVLSVYLLDTYFPTSKTSEQLTGQLGNDVGLVLNYGKDIPRRDIKTLPIEPKPCKLGNCKNGKVCQLATGKCFPCTTQLQCDANYGVGNTVCSNGACVTPPSPLPDGSVPALNDYIEGQLTALPQKYLVPITSDNHLDFAKTGNRYSWVKNEFDRFKTLSDLISGKSVAYVLELGDKGGGCGAGASYTCSPPGPSPLPSLQISRYAALKNDVTRWTIFPNSPPWITVMGNHEIDSTFAGYTPISERRGKADWIEMLYPGLQHNLRSAPGTFGYTADNKEVYYAVAAGDFVYVVLDQNKMKAEGLMHFSSEIPQNQLDYIDAVFNHPAAQGKIGVILMHEPLVKRSTCNQIGSPLKWVTQNNGNPTNIAKRQNALDTITSHPQIQLVLSGHISGCREHFKYKNRVFVIADTKGDWNYYLDIDETNQATPWKLGTINKNGNPPTLITTFEDYGNQVPNL